LKRVIVNRIS